MYFSRAQQTPTYTSLKEPHTGKFMLKKHPGYGSKCPLIEILAPFRIDINVQLALIHAINYREHWILSSVNCLRVNFLAVRRLDNYYYFDNIR